MNRIAHILSAATLAASLTACSAAPVASPSAPSDFHRPSVAQPRLGIPEAGSVRAAYKARAIEFKTPAEPGHDS